MRRNPIFGIVWTLLFTSCSGEIARPPLPLSPITREALPAVSPQEEWTRLTRIETEQNQELLVDVKEVLLAELASPQRAPALWKQAANHIQGRLGKYAASKSKEILNGTPLPSSPGTVGRIGDLPRSEMTPVQKLREQQTQAIFLRKNDARKQAADIYLALMEAYARPEITAEAMQMPEEGFFWMKLDDVMWTARYQALVGNYEIGQQFIEKARALLQAGPPATATKANKIRYATTLADTYHTEAFRITIEKGDFIGAAHQMDAASQIPDMNTEWKERVQWYQGFYRYLAGDAEAALPYWTDLLPRTKEGEMRDKLTFWIMHLYHQKGNHAAATRLLRLLQSRDRLNFYTLAAEQRLGLPSYIASLGSPTELQQRLVNKKKYAIRALVKNKKLEKSLQKIELLLQADLYRFARWSALDFSAEVKKNLKCSSVHFECYLYLSRLLYATHNYKAAIQVTQQLAQANPKLWEKWPEQLLIAFPQAYFNLYQAEAKKNHASITDLLALSRQESLFDEGAESPAQAYGLMQLILPTAIRVQEKSIADPRVLLQPETNLEVGSRYVHMLLARYPGPTKFPVYAAYNAGEYAVDRWVQKRQHQDPFVWVELIPFGETRKYVQQVWRNAMVYEHLYTPLGVETVSR